VPGTEVEQVTERFAQAFNAREWPTVRDLLADDVLIEDRRPARGFPQMRNADDFVDRLKASIEAVPDREMGASVWIIRRPSSGVSRNEFRGHDAIGGGEVVSDRIAVLFTANGRYSQLGFFEPDDEAGALAYFDAEQSARS
jgi:hypothetical protein